jgi:hypothetical protein
MQVDRDDLYRRTTPAASRAECQACQVPADPAQRKQLVLAEPEVRTWVRRVEEPRGRLLLGLGDEGQGTGRRSQASCSLSSGFKR